MDLYNLTEHTQGSRVMYLNSADADINHYKTTHFTFTFKEALHTRPHEMMLVSLISASIPYSFYNIREGINDTLKYQVLENEDTITLSAGNYTANSLKTALIDAFNSNTGLLKTYTGDNTEYALHTLDLGYHFPTQKYTFSLTKEDGAGGVDVTLLFSQSKLAVELGFVDEDVQVSVNSDATGPNVADVNGLVHALYVRTDLPTKSVFESLSGGVSDILGKVNLNTNPGGIIVHEPGDTAHKTLVASNHIRTLSLRVTDERNQVLDLNGLHFQLGIKFEFISVYIANASLVPQFQQNTQQNTQQNKKQQRRKALKKGKKKVKRAIAKQQEVSKKQSQTTTAKKKE